MELSPERYRVAADRNPNVGSFRLSLHHDVSEGAAIFTRRGKDSANSSKRAEVCIAEGISPAHRRAARIVGLPWSKKPTRLNIPHRFGIYQGGSETEWLAWTDLIHLKIADVEFERQLIWFERVNHKPRLFADEFIHINLDLPLRYNEVIAPLLLWRDIQFQTFQVNTVDSHRRVQQVQNTGAEPEFFNRDQRL